MYLFTYGTLMQGEFRHNVLEKARFVCYGKATGKLFHYTKGNYPVYFRSGTDEVRGEVYEIPADMIEEYLSALDQIEGTVYNLYAKREIPVCDANSDTQYICIVYEGASAFKPIMKDLKRLPTGTRWTGV